MQFRAWTIEECEYDGRRVEVAIEDEGGWRDVRLNGKYVGQVYYGKNGEWFPVTRHEESHAYPVGSLENVKGTGWATPEDAVVSWLGLRDREGP